MAIKLLLSPQTTAHPLQHPPAGDTAECRKVESMFPNHMSYKNTINTWLVLISLMVFSTTCTQEMVEKSAIGCRWLTLCNYFKLAVTISMTTLIKRQANLIFWKVLCHSHVTQCQSHIQVTSVPIMNDTEVKHYLSSLTQGWCSHCQKTVDCCAKLMVLTFIIIALLIITKPEHFCNMG